MSFATLLQGFQGVRALVVGDLMLDEYIVGKATRISPEAPVMVVHRQSIKYLPGGAANVAGNLVAMGGKVSMVGVVGRDDAGQNLIRTLQNAGIDTTGVLEEANRVTTRKTRVLADHAHQVLRIDHETEEMVEASTEAAALERIRAALPNLDVLVLSDYLKGTITECVAQCSLKMAADLGIPVVVNPKPRSLKFYSGATLISLNRLEATEALGGVYKLRDEEALAAAETIRTQIHADSVLITLGDVGIAATGPESFIIPAPRVEVYDTAGAGDTVIATVALGIATTGFSREVFALAAHTAASVVRKVGVAVPSKEDLSALASISC